MESFHGIIDALVRDTVGHGDLPGSLACFSPELTLAATIVVMLLVRLFGFGNRVSPVLLALVGSVAALYFASCDASRLLAGQVESQELFTGLLVFDSATIFFRWLLLSFVVLFCVMTRISGMPNPEDGTDFYTLVLGSTLGMCLMASANHLMMVFLAIEMASVPSYVLVGSLRESRKSSEAALKYAVYGAGTAGIMLYGISLLCGILGTAHLPTLATQLIELDVPARLAASGTSSGVVGVLMLGCLMVMVGLAFKLSAVPFHFWCPDAFEGAPAEVNAFLSVASKAAALALLVRLVVGVAVPPDAKAESQVVQAAVEAHLVSGTPDEAATSVNNAPTGSDADALAPVRGFLLKLIALLAAVTCTFGNLAAYGQTNIKRMLAYSTIAHAGYMLMPVCAALALADQPVLARGATAALLFYIVTYLFMNLGAFAVVAFLRNATGSEEIADYAGLVRSCPTTVVCFALMFFSLIGLPPLAGFAGKFAIFTQLVTAGGPVMMGLLVLAGLNTAISLVYYLRVIKTMTIDPDPDNRGPVEMGFFPASYTVAITVPVLVFGVWFNDLYRWALAATEHLFS